MNIRFERDWSCEVRGHTFRFEKGTYEVGRDISPEAAKLAMEKRVAVPTMPRLETKPMTPNLETKETAKKRGRPRKLF